MAPSSPATPCWPGARTQSSTGTSSRRESRCRTASSRDSCIDGRADARDFSSNLDIGRVRSCIRPIIATDSMAARPDGDRGSRPHQRVALVALKTLLSIGPLIADYCQLSFFEAIRQDGSARPPRRPDSARANCAHNRREMGERATTCSQPFLSRAMSRRAAGSCWQSLELSGNFAQQAQHDVDEQMRTKLLK